MRWALAIIAALLLVGCAKGCSDRPATPASEPPAAPGVEATPSEREAYWRRQLAEAKAQLAAAQDEARAAEDRTWRTWTRWVGLAGFVLAAAAAGVLSWLVSPKIGLPVGLIVAGVAAAVVTFGAVVRWLPLAMGGAVLLAGGVWLLYHLRHRTLVERASRALDAVEHEGTEALREAKAGLGAAVARAGGSLQRRLDRLRGPDRRWGRPLP